MIHHNRSNGIPLDDLLRRSDVVSLHVPLNAETEGLISRERLALLRDGATLVNTARGALVDEDALVEELASGRISADSTSSSTSRTSPSGCAGCRTSC